MPSTTRTATKQKTLVPIHRVQSVIVQPTDSHHNSDSEDNTKEPDNTPLAKANIPTIVDAVLSNVSTKGTSLRDESQDISHLGE